MNAKDALPPAAESSTPNLAQVASVGELEPCEKAHDAEHDRWADEDGACDDGLRGS